MGRLARLQARIQKAATPGELWKIAGEIGSATRRASPELVRRPRAVKSKRRGKPDSRVTMAEALHLAADTGDPRAVMFVLDGEAAALDELYYAECHRMIPSARKPSLAEIERDS
jgi:hypothetical protein